MFITIICLTLFTTGLALPPPPRLCDGTDPTDAPSPNNSCVYCYPGVEGPASGCLNGGTCYFQPLPGVPAPGLPLCGCFFEFAGPTCAFPAPPKPICNVSDPTSRPPACTFCNPLTNEGCLNGGTCYYEPSIPGAPPPGLPICGCRYGLAPPTCAFPAPALRFCNASDPTDLPPGCQFCDPAMPSGSNGCLNFGRCTLQGGFNSSFPPNFELPICACQGLLIPPQCAQIIYTVFADSPDNAVELRWIWVTLFCIVVILSMLVIAQHTYFGLTYKFTLSNIFKLAGALCVLAGSLSGLVWQAVNPYGLVYAFPTANDVIATSLALTFGISFLTIAISIATGNWLWIAYNATVPLARVENGWPLVSTILVALVSCTMLACSIGFSVAQVNADLTLNIFFIFSAFVIVMCLFSVVSGILIIATMKSLDIADPRLLKRTSIQLIVLSTAEMICAILIIILNTLPNSLFTSFQVFFGLTQTFPILVLFILAITLLIGFRIAVWQLKEVALPRPNTVASNSNTSSAKRFQNSSNVSATSVTDGEYNSEERKVTALPPGNTVVKQSDEEVMYVDL